MNKIIKINNKIIEINNKIIEINNKILNKVNSISSFQLFSIIILAILIMAFFVYNFVTNRKIKTRIQAIKSILDSKSSNIPSNELIHTRRDNCIKKCKAQNKGKKIKSCIKECKKNV